MRFYEITWDYMKFDGILISRKSKGFHGISWNFIEFHGISWDFMEYPGISCELHLV